MKGISVLLALVVGFVVGYYVPQPAVETEEAPSHSHHEIREVEEPIPTVDLVVHEDPKSGWNAQVLVTNFTFAPENVSTDHVPGEGHAHIYVDGVKINRVYGEWYHLGNLSEGTHEVSVRLSSNDHKELGIDGEVILDIETVEVAVMEVMEEDDHHDDEMEHDSMEAME